MVGLHTCQHVFLFLTTSQLTSKVLQLLPAVLATVRRAIKADPARTQSCPKSAAKSQFRLSDKDLEVGDGGCTAHVPAS
jgi:hypothetical protein